MATAAENVARAAPSMAVEDLQDHVEKMAAAATSMASVEMVLAWTSRLSCFRVAIQ